MRSVIGFGDFKDFTLQEVPDDFLGELADRFPFVSAEHAGSTRKQLLATIAIHEELRRRKSGGAQLRRRPTKKQFAEEIIKKGFHSLSKTHHPDRNGDNESQRLLTSARDFLYKASREIEEEYSDDDFVIEVETSDMSAQITDEDIPF